MTEDSVPDDANGVLILSPTNDLNAEDADKLIAYLNNGGKVLISTSYIDCFSEEMPNLTKVLSEFGLSIGDGLIVEQDNARMYQNPIYLLPNVSSDSLTNGVYGKSYDYIMMPYAQPILTKEKDGVTLTTLLTTSEKAYSKTDLNQSSDVKKTEDDAQETIYCRRKSGENTCFRRRSTAGFIQLVLSVHRIGKPVHDG